jgi:hypothetical protein
LNPSLEALYFRQEHARWSFLVTLLYPSFSFPKLIIVVVELWSDVKFNSVVTSRDGLDIPFDIVVFLRLLNVVNVVDDEKGNEDGAAANHESLFLPLNEIVIIDQAGDLKEYERIGRGAFSSIKAFLVCHDKFAKVAYLTVVFTDAVLC